MKLEGVVTHGIELNAVGCVSNEVVIAFGPIGSYVDMSQFYTMEQTDALLDDKADKVDTYTKDETDALLDTKADKSTTYTKNEVDEMMSNVDTEPTEGSTNFVTSGGVFNALEQKVDKIPGKGLSSHDFTSAYKTKLIGIEEGAERNIIERIYVNGYLLPVENKNVNIPAATNTMAGVMSASDKRKLNEMLSAVVVKVSDRYGTYEADKTLTDLDIAISQGRDVLYIVNNAYYYRMSFYVPTQCVIAVRMNLNEPTMDSAKASYLYHSITGVTVNSLELASVTDIPTDLSDLNNDVGFITSQALANYADGAEYDSATHYIYLKHGNTRLPNPINAADFIKDGMVETVTVGKPATGPNAGVDCLIVTFNTDAGESPIELPLTQIFDPTNYYTKTEVDTALSGKQATLTFDTTPTANSTNPVTSGGVFSALRYDGNSTNYVASDDSFEDCIESLDSELANKQDTLVSGTNIKTVNGTTLLGSGDIDAKELVYGKIQGTSFYSAIRNPRSGNWTFTDYAKTPNEKKIYIDILTNIIYKYDADVGYVQIGGGQIKTINGQSLIGSGNVTLDTETVNYDGDGNTYFAAGDSLTGGLDSMADAIDNINPNEISSVTATESSVSGGNNVVTITQTNGTTTSFNVKNGIDGVDGQDGADGVSLGEVALVQTTGSGTDVVMSQDAVTEYGRKVSSVDDEYGSSEYMQTILESLGWAFNKKINNSGSLADSAGCCATPFIPCDNISGHSIMFSYRMASPTAAYAMFYKANKTAVGSSGYMIQNAANSRIFTFGTIADTSYVRYSISMNDIPHCYIYDYTDKKYIFKGDEYLNDIYKSYNVGFGYFGEKEVNDYTFIKATYFKGVLSDFFLSEFPNLDPRTCDGISLLFNAKPIAISNRRMFLEIYAHDYNVNTGTYFAIADNWSNLRGGLLTNYYQTISNGANVSLASGKNIGAHFVFTFNFKTGELVAYNNGVEAGRTTPEDFDSQALYTYFNGCSAMRFGYFQTKDENGMTGMALFPRVLDASEVSELYDIGGKSTKNELIPRKWQANFLHPLFYSGSNIGIFIQSGATRTTVDDKAVLTATATTVAFGFNGINGLINNVIYEWDMEVVSGEWYPYHNGTARRVMQYNNSYYNVVHIYDTSGVEVTDDNLATGNYHVFCNPNNIFAGSINAVLNQLIYRFITTVDSVIKISNLKVTERGSALVCDINNFKGEYFEQVNGDKVPKALSGTYNNNDCIPYYDTYKDDVIAYSSSKKVQFTGQMAVDTANNKVYVGYLTGNGGSIWKQINNS